MTKEARKSVHSYLLGSLFVLGLLWTAWASLAPPSSLPVLNFPDKAAHAINYAILAILLSMAWQRLSAWLVVFCVVTFGGLIELAQLKTGYRQGEWLDMLANLAGAVAGVIAWWWYQRGKRESVR